MMKLTNEELSLMLTALNYWQDSRFFKDDVTDLCKKLMNEMMVESSYELECG
jgi:hypothetical protein